MRKQIEANTEKAKDPAERKAAKEEHDLIKKQPKKKTIETKRRL